MSGTGDFSVARRGWRVPAVAMYGALVLTVVLCGAAAAWACVPQPLISIQPQSSGPAGSQVTVDGVSLGPGPVEIRWNRLDGPTLAKSSGPNFSQPVTIPEAPEGLYTIIVIQREPGGAIAGSGRAAFQVSAPGVSRPVAPAGRTSEGAGQGGTSNTSSAGLDPALAWGGGATLLVVGGVGGAWFSQRRRGIRGTADDDLAQSRST